MMAGRDKRGAELNDARDDQRRRPSARGVAEAGTGAVASATAGEVIAMAASGVVIAVAAAAVTATGECNWPGERAMSVGKREKRPEVRSAGTSHLRRTAERGVGTVVAAGVVAAGVVGAAKAVSIKVAVRAWLVTVKRSNNAW